MSESKSLTQVKRMLKRNKKKEVCQTIDNCLVVLRNDPVLQDAIRQNILTDRQDIVKDVGWVRSSTTITDTDYQYIMHYLEHNSARVKYLLCTLAFGTEEEKRDIYLNCREEVKKIHERIQIFDASASEKDAEAE